MRRFIVLFCCLLLIWLAASRAIAGEINCFWTSGARLLPAWGFYPNGSSYGGTAPLGKASAWTSGGGTHTLTWVADFPADGVWQVWVRQYGGYGEVTVEVDGRTVVGGRGGPGGGRYVWRHQGGVNVPVGSHHVDLTVNHGMLDVMPPGDRFPHSVGRRCVMALTTFVTSRPLTEPSQPPKQETPRTIRPWTWLRPWSTRTGLARSATSRLVVDGFITQAVFCQATSIGFAGDWPTPPWR